MDESVLRGNTAILKCHIPSFVADYVFVSSWTSDDGDEYTINANHVYGIETQKIFLIVYSIIFRFVFLKNSVFSKINKARVRCGFPYLYPNIFIIFLYVPLNPE